MGVLGKIMGAIDRVEDETTRRLRLARASAARIARFALEGEGDPPSWEELVAFAGATGARDTGRDDASRVLRAARARIAMGRGERVTCGDLAAALGRSRQHVYRLHGASCDAATARALLAPREAAA